MTPWLDDGDVQLYHGDVVDVLRALPAGVAQTCVTSPPYWGLRDYGTGAQLGLEATPAEYVERMVEVFREVWRVLRSDGTVWLNLGDSYASSSSTGRKDAVGLAIYDSTHGHSLRTLEQRTQRRTSGVGETIRTRATPPGFKAKDLIGIPWRVAFALQADGWYLRSDIIWSKPNPMPESVSDRPTKAHEYLFLLSKQPRYYYDADAIREPSDDKQGRIIPDGHEATWVQGMNGAAATGRIEDDGGKFYGAPVAGRNRRSVWTIPTQPYAEAHFATYPEALVRPCILAGTSERGECSECGAPWTREVDIERTERVSGGPSPAHTTVKGYSASSAMVTNALPTYTTTGWRASCTCDAPTRPQLVLDPFIGSGTTAHVARKHGRRCIGIDLSAEYLTIAAQRLNQLSLLA